MELPLVVSGDTADALAAAAVRVRAEVESAPDEALTDLRCRCLAMAHAQRRGAVIATDRAELLRGLTALAQGRASRNVLTGTMDVAGKPVLVFPGQGAHWPGMAGELLASSPELRARIDGYAEALHSHLGWDPGVALTRGEDLTRLGTIQPVQFALSSAFADLWRAYGLQEVAVVGHSVGEVAAARAAGALSTEEAARLVVLCGTAFTRIEGQGAMASIAAPVERVRPRLGKWEGRLDVAAVNSARNVTISGDPDAVGQLLAELTAEGIWAWRVPGVDVAGHSSQVDVLRELMLGQAPATTSGTRRAGFYSTVTGSRIDGELTAMHWFRALRDTVLFEQAVRALIADGHRLFVEMSAHPVLTTVINETLRAMDVTGVAISTLDRRKPDGQSFLHALTHAWVNGAPIDWTRLGFPPQAARTHSRQEQPPTRLIDHAALRQAAPAQQAEMLIDVIAGETTAVLGHAFAASTQTFREIGFSSLTVVELAGALSAATGLDLAPTLVFDHPTPAALATHLRHELGLASASSTPAIHARAEDPIAIVGIGCRFPGGVTSAESLWALVMAGRDVVGDHPTDRGWDTNNLYDPTPGKPGRVSSRTGGFLHEAASFDAGFFGLSPREAAAMEPQQRLLLEVSWEAVEHAGIDPESLRGSRTGVFAGVISQEYGPRLQQAADDVAGHAFMGTATCVASGRVAYALGLEGPAITLDTACSSSLVAIHQACQALRGDDCDLALAGGATVMSTPGVLVEFSQQRVLAPDGRCKAFSAAADGIALSEGVGMVVLERLSDARSNGHPVLAVIRGSAINSDGASNGLTAPSGSAQQRVIRHALTSAGLSTQDVDAIEAHGTGTRLGDPIEARALLATYGRDRPAERPVWLGSIKSNMGHTQAAAGVAGLIKMVMALRQGVLPMSLHIDAPSPHVDWSSGAIRLLAEQQQWPDVGDHPRRAAVSSFGVSGTNSHVIVEQAPAAQVAPAETPTAEVLWPLSAKTETALRAQAARLREHVTGDPDLDPVAVGHSLRVTRSQFAHRAVVWGRSRDQLVEGLHALAGHRTHPTLAEDMVPAAGPGKLVLVFSGQGCQWPGMGMGLYDVFPVYRQALDEADEALRPFTRWSVVNVLRGDPEAPSLDRIDVLQPALFAVLTALARLWQSFGLVPDAVMGHSQGEIAAAHFAGILTLPDAAKMVALRAQALATLSGTGAMATLGLSEDRTQSLIEQYDGHLSVAAINSPAATVVSGNPVAIAELLRRCEAERVHARRIDVDVAGHSQYIAPLRHHILEQFANITPHPTDIAFHSTVDGYPHDIPLDGTALTAEYWYDNLRSPIRFADTVQSLAGQGHRTFLECGPHPVLVPAIEETLDTAVFAVGSLHRAKPQTGSFTAAVAHLHAHGHNLRWPTGTVVDVPTYPFDHRRYWLTPPPSGEVRAVGQRSAGHPLIGAVIDLPDDQGLLLTGRVGLATHPWLADHAAAGVVLLPGTAYLDMALHAADLAGCRHIAELTLHAPIVLPDEEAVDLRLRVSPPDDDGHRPLAIHARADDDSLPWTLHATGLLAQQPPTHQADPISWPPDGAEPVDLTGLRRRLSEAGYDYGPAFSGLHTAWRQGRDVYTEADLPEGLAVDGHTVHPALLDTALHPIALPDETGEASLRLPFTFTGITRMGTPGRHLRVHLHQTKPDTVSVTATDAAGVPGLTIDALTLRAATSDHLRRLVQASPEHDLLHMTWRPLPTAEADTAGWAVLDNASPLTATVPGYAGLSALTTAVESGTPAPEVVIWPLPPADAPRHLCEQVLGFLREWLAHEHLTRTVLAVVTRHAVVTGPQDPPDLAHSAAWGLLHTAQNENPGRIVLVDTDHRPESLAALTATLVTGSPQSAIRGGRPCTPELTRASTMDVLAAPPGTPLWRLDTTGPGGLDNLTLIPAPEAADPLGSGQVRIEVRAAGVNFYDTASALGLIPPQHDFGAEAAGVVTETGPGVDGLTVGDRVMALTERSFGPVVVADHRMTVRIPDAWSFAEAAGLPVAFVTAYHALVDLANVQPGETVLIHAAAGGVGQAATQLARYLGAEPFATAHPGKWDTLRRLGYPEDHIANSRTLDFAGHFRGATGGHGMDVVLNSLAGPFVDASLDLVAPGGRFIELGKTDVRDAQYPDLTYHAMVDRRGSADPDRTKEILAELLRLFADGTLTALPVTCYSIRHATDAFRLMRDARHIGKIVLTLPRPLDPGGTVLITGGTGTLGGLLAHHLVTTHGTRHLLLASRSGSAAAGADDLRAGLENLGARVTITACDTADPDAVRQLLAAISLEHPLTGVFHTAGVLADATIANLTPDGFDAVFGPKVDAAWHLHEQTEHLDLAAFVLYSSSAGTFGNPGQGNYAAANAFLDALAHHRRRQGLPGTSLAWGWWQPVTGMSRSLTDTDHTRIARTGLAPITAEHGHALLDAALALPHPVFTAAPLNQHTLRDNSFNGTLHPLLTHLTTTAREPQTTAGPASDLRQDLAALAPDARLRHLRTVIATHAATVLNLDATTPFPPDQPFKAFGFDSLTALELRNRLTVAIGLRLPASLTYDYPTPNALAAHLGDQLFPAADDDRPATAEDCLMRQAIAAIPLTRLRELGLLDTLLQLAEGGIEAVHRNDIETASVDELVAIALSTEENT